MASTAAKQTGPAEQTKPTGPTSTRERILHAFLRVVTVRGLEGTTTRAVAEEARVNEVTLFRHFGDKAGMALAAVREFSPAADLTARDPAVDASTPHRAADGLLAALKHCHTTIHDRTELLYFGVGESQRMPEVAREVAAVPQAVMAFLDRALEQAAPALRPDVDQRTTVLQWVGMIVHASLMVQRGVMSPMSKREWDRILTAAVRCVVQQGGEWRNDKR